jgi:hypothetical protein
LEINLRDRFEHPGSGPAKPMMAENSPMPCSLQGTNKTLGVSIPSSAATDVLTHQLATAEFTLQTDAAKQTEAIDSIENVLNLLTSYHAAGADWSPSHYADLAVKASLRAGRPGQARAILLRGLQLEPDSDQLRYLSRVLIREKILQPGDAVQAGVR